MRNAWDKFLATVGTVLAVPAALVMIIAVTLLVLTFGVYVIMFVGIMLFAFVLVWATGFKITISEGDKKVGYIRWFTFYPEEDK